MKMENKEKNNREKYDTLTIEVIRFETEDVIMTSGNQTPFVPIDPANPNGI